MIKVKANDSICIRLRLARRIWPWELKIPALLSAAAPGIATSARSRLERSDRTIRVR